MKKNAVADRQSPVSNGYPTSRQPTSRISIFGAGLHKPFATGLI